MINRADPDGLATAPDLCELISEDETAGGLHNFQKTAPGSSSWCRRARQYSGKRDLRPDQSADPDGLAAAPDLCELISEDVTAGGLHDLRKTASGSGSFAL